MNSVHILRNSPSQLLELWEADHTLCEKLQLVNTEKDVFFEHLVNCCKADVFEGLAIFFSFLLCKKKEKSLSSKQPVAQVDGEDNNAESKDEQEQDFLNSEEQDQFLKKFAFCIKYGVINIVTLPDFIEYATSFGKQTTDAVFQLIKSKLTESTKNLKKVKECQIFTDRQVKILEGHYKNAIKLSLVIHTASKAPDFAKMKVRLVSSEDLLSFEIK